MEQKQFAKNKESNKDWSSDTAGKSKNEEAKEKKNEEAKEL
jgi:hypothetical protein